MPSVAEALAGTSPKHGLAFFSADDWAAIYTLWVAGASYGDLYRRLVAADTMPYKSQRSFYRAFENYRDKRTRNERRNRT